MRDKLRTSFDQSQLWGFGGGAEAWWCVGTVEAEECRSVEEMNKCVMGVLNVQTAYSRAGQ